MTDRELLELAAKAAEMSVIDSGGLGLRIASDGCKTGYMWNPLADDGDALRLAVKLGMRVKIYHRMNLVSAFPETDYGSDEPFTDDPYAATRRAIVRAAAEIGKDMN